MPINVNTSINQTHLPQDIAVPNEFVSYANSFILMPMLGPLTINKRIKTVAQAIYYLNKFVDLIDSAVDVAVKIDSNSINLHTDLGFRVATDVVDDVSSEIGRASIGASRATTTLLSAVSPTVASYSSGILGRASDPSIAVAATAPASVLLRLISQLNPVFDMAFDAKKIVKTGVLVNANEVQQYKVLNNNLLKYTYLLEKFIKPSKATDANIANYLTLFKSGADYANAFGPNTARMMLNGGARPISKKAKNLIARFLFDALDFDFDLYGKGNLSGANANSEEAEWGLIRRDKITVTIKEKLLRGPIETSSVSPNAVSEVVNSFESIISSTSGKEDVSSTSTLTRQSRSIADNIATSITNSVESGARNQSSFNNNSLVRNSMTERLSSASREELRLISQMNRVASISSYEERISRSTMYKTEGIDDQLSNTEVLFESFAKTAVSANVDDIGLVWCPRITAPYMNINRQIYRAARQARIDYRRINYVVDPAEPPLHYETQEVYSEIHIRGRNESQQASKSITIPANLVSDDWELDEDEVVTGFRNGTSDDYNWDEAWNWDDLENWSTTLLSLTRRGNIIDVTVRLETTDPEYFNRGFITIALYFKKLTEESKSALSAYERQRETSNLERRSVNVRARQLADLKKQELITSTVKSHNEIKKILIYNLLRHISVIEKRKNISLYYETLKSCLDWDSVHIENEISSNPPFPLYPHDHFINTPAARLFLPVRKEKEADFVNLMKLFATSVYASKIDNIVNTVKARRTDLQNMANPPVLFSYDDEIVLGVHRENVFSNTNFKFV